MEWRGPSILKGGPMGDLERLYMEEPLDHEGHARCVIYSHGKRIKHTNTHGWLVYNGVVWTAETAEAYLGRAIVKMLRLRTRLIKEKVEDPKAAAKMITSCKANQHNVSGIKQRLQDQPEVEATIATFDNEPFLLNCSNGTVDLKTGDLLDHDPLHYLTTLITVDYYPDAPAEEWHDFLGSLEMSDSVMDFLQLAMGYSITGDTSEEVLFYIAGPPRSGKGTIFETFLDIFGDLASGLNFRTFTADRAGDTQNFDLAPLTNKRLVVASESNQRERLNAATLKQVTGGDSIYCAFKYGRHFTYKPKYKIWLSSNHPADTDPTDTAAWSRLRVIEFKRSFLGREDKSLKRRLLQQENKQAILAWLIEGALQWYESGLSTPDEVTNATELQKLQANSAAIFIDDCCTLHSPNDNAFAPGTTLYHSYTGWCKEEGYMPFGRKNFTVALTELGIATGRKVHDGKTTRGFPDISFDGWGRGAEDVTNNRTNFRNNGRG
jgi:putative DNA primase/helicase